MSIFKVDEKWSIEYDPKNNDRPVAWLRYENKSHPFGHVNAVTAMFYALLEDRTKLAKAVEMALEECPFREGTGSYNDWWYDRKTKLAELEGKE